MAVYPLRGLSICSGVGGLDLGVHRALGGRYVPVCHVEGEAYAARVLVARMEDKTLGQAPIWADVRTFDAQPWRGKVDIITAGIPCQPWSAARQRRGKDDERHLWGPVCGVIEALEPRYVFIENVPGLLSKGGLEPIWRDLREMGYEVEAGIFSAAQVGAPHLRKRVFILAHTEHLPGRRAEHGGGKDSGQKALHAGRYGAHRAVADANSFAGSEGIGAPWRWEPDASGPVWRFAQSPVCRGNNGVADRLDRLRALGNAVVPATAELAFRTLLEEARAG